MLLVSLRSDYPGEWHRFVNGEALTLSISRDRFPYIAQGHPIAVQGIGVVALATAPPAPTALLPAQVGLSAFPTFAPGQRDGVSLVFADLPQVIERNADAHPFLLIRFAIQ